MDASHLSKAHDHARAAAVATRQSSSDPTSAITEHTHAAGEFANAARSTSSVEALRTLRLLEQHHRRLAEILQLPPERTAAASAVSHGSDGTEINEKGGSEKSGETVPGLRREGSSDVATARTGSKPTLSQQRREMSSSIASNLASARGIKSKYRGTPLTPSVSSDQAPGSLDPHSRRDGSRTKMQNIIEHQSGKPTWVPPMAAPNTKPVAPVKAVSSPRGEASTAVTDDAGYGRFYNTFGSIINKISAPLAFAGLPLIQEESTTSEQQETATPAMPKSPRRSKSSHSSASAADPDLSKIYSKATMRALARDGHTSLPSDSFYVVPTSGHTMSYASILTYAEKEKRRLGASTHSGGPSDPGVDDGEDDFVDARESPVPLSPGAKRRIGKAKSERDLNNTLEELYTENKSLKDLLDKLTQRLHAFEASSQTSAMALAESYRVMRPGSPLTPGSGGGGGGVGPSGSSSSKEAEEQLAAMMKQMEKLEKDNRKMQKTLEKYREKWELLKKGAKARREAQGPADSLEDAAAVE
ncbi:hypothetical protein NLU13_4769 [Sarocladium strictum]|uniref:Uncharacterized protein n=1 Tax=Sarocladium strictum TaxID=5046 RepID=A0AA39GK58_SARSR|nr:hypothetical protein NLU13_4769 [Sarocladium strictum]